MMSSFVGQSISLKEGQSLPLEYGGDFMYDHNNGKKIFWMSPFQLHIWV